MKRSLKNNGEHSWLKLPRSSTVGPSTQVPKTSGRNHLLPPNDILIGHHSCPPQLEQEARVNPRHLLRSVQNRVADFWTCWLKYFAPSLLPRNKWFRKRENVKIGDLILELNPHRKRLQWEMALIVGTYPGEDGLVRKVRIRTQNGEYDRPVHKLCVIAVKQELCAK